MDKLGNLITKIRNAYLADHQSVLLTVDRKNILFLNLLLNYSIFTKEIKHEKDVEYVFNDQIEELILKRISKPGRKIYSNAKELAKEINKKAGFDVISTSKGVMTGREALKKNLGGEIICHVTMIFKHGLEY